MELIITEEDRQLIDSVLERYGPEKAIKAEGICYKPNLNNLPPFDTVYGVPFVGVPGDPSNSGLGERSLIDATLPCREKGV
jgi:hypothetical protein